MKVKYHIPTEQYGFVEVEVEVTGENVPDSYSDIKDLFRKKDAGEPVQ